MSRYDEQYRQALGLVLDQPAELNMRTGKAVRAYAGLSMRIDLEDDGFPLLSLRKMPMSFVPEVMWILSGTKDAKWLSAHTKIWDAFKDEDGSIGVAYGYRIRQSFGVDQLDEVVRKLDEDPSTRHGVVQIWDASEDLTIPRKNIPCPVMFTVGLIRGRLNLHLVIRSNDMVLGHPTDVAGFALLAHMLAQRLGAVPGVMTVSISNAHVYEDQVPFAEEMCRRESRTDEVRLSLPGSSYSRACSLDGELLGEIKAGVHGYRPGEAMKGIPIAL